MALELRQERVVMRVDGDVLEIFQARTGSERVLLSWLAVQVQPAVKGRLILRIMSTPDDTPLYELLHKARTSLGTVTELVISAEDEPYYRQFFTQVAQSCGRFVAP